MAAVVGILLIWAIIAWLGVAGPIWHAYWTASPEQWLGFAGAIAGALATIAAGGAALFAAYKTLGPVKAQLDQLVKQNDHNLLDRLVLRATKLNNEEVLIQQIVAGCELVSKTLENLTGGNDVHARVLLEAVNIAVSRLEKFVAQIQMKRGDVWGDSDTQELHQRFADLALRCGSQAVRISTMADKMPRLAFVALKGDMKDWKRLADEINSVGNRLSQLVRAESKRIGEAIAEVETRLFGFHGPARLH